jgi:D-sedoheptulose 7-phosphate isomerase
VVASEGLLDRARTHLQESADLKNQVALRSLSAVLAAAELIVDTFQRGGKVMLCGNGGSAADCQHMAAEFVGQLTREFERPGLPAIALTTDTSFLTAFANDWGFEEVFERQVRALGKRGDTLIAISTSGNSTNVLRAVKAARELGITTIGLMGECGALKSAVECAIAVPSRRTQYIQETLLSIEHVLCDLTEQILLARGR